MAYSLTYTLNSDGASYSVSGYSNISTSDNVEIPDTYNGHPVTSISGGAFDHCNSLTRVTIGNNVTRIGDGAFYYCINLTSAIIGNGVINIGDYAFDGCTELTQLILFPLTPPDLNSTLTIPNNVQSIYVQQSSKAAYQAAMNWAAFATKIVSDNLYLSFVRFNQKNKEYIDRKVNESTPPSVNVVQTTGSSETNVMSQKAVTDAINAAVTTALNTEV